MTEKFSVHPDQLPHYLYEMAQKALSVAEQVETPMIVLDLVAALPDPELPLSALDMTQKSIVAKFLLEMIPDAELDYYGLTAS